MLRWFLKKLEINVNFLKASDLKFEGKKSELVLDMCKKLNATTYIFGELGKNYADIKKFDSLKIKTVFQEFWVTNFQTRRFPRNRSNFRIFFLASERA